MRSYARGSTTKTGRGRIAKKEEQPTVDRALPDQSSTEQGNMQGKEKIKKKKEKQRKKNKKKAAPLGRGKVLGTQAGGPSKLRRGADLHRKISATEKNSSSVKSRSVKKERDEGIKPTRRRDVPFQLMGCLSYHGASYKKKKGRNRGRDTKGEIWGQKRLGLREIVDQAHVERPPYARETGEKPSSSTPIGRDIRHHLDLTSEKKMTSGRKGKKGEEGPPKQVPAKRRKKLLKPLSRRQRRN